MITSNTFSPSKARTSLLQKYSLVFGMVVLFSLALSGMTSLYFFYEQSRSAVLAQEREKAIAAADKIGQYITDIEQRIAHMLPAKKGLSALQKRISEVSFLAQIPAITQVTLLDQNGRERFHSSTSSPDVFDSLTDHSMTEAFRQAKPGQPYRSQIQFKNQVQPYMVIAMTVGPQDAGITIVELNLEFLLEGVSRIKIGESGYAYVLDSHGQLVAHPNLSLVMSRENFSGLPQWSAAKARIAESDQAATKAVDSHGNRVLAAYALIPHLEWWVFAEQPLAEALAPVYASLLRQGLFLLLGLMGALIASVVIVRKMVSPVHALRRGAMAIGAGLLDYRIKVQTGDELEDLSDQFNQMAQQLQASYANLEQRVLSRTAELTQQKELAQQQNWELAVSHSNLQETQERLKSAYLSLKEHETELTQARMVAEDASKQKSAFLATISHEMRTPLGGVIGILGLALRDTRLWPDIRQQIELARRNAKSLLYIINDVLDISKIEAGKLTLESVDFDLPGMIREASALLNERAHDKDLLLNLDIGPGVPRFCLGDPTRIRQVIINLLGNAIKFTKQGEVRLSARVLELKPNLTWVEFTVSDTGPGISEKAIDRLFEKFEQADASTTRRFGGTGLGLAICKELVSLMGGTIQVKSTLGQGSVFSFRLPLTHGSKTLALPDNGWIPQSHLYQLRILCAEDGPTNQIIIRSLLEEMGHMVDLVEDGLSAIKALSEKDYDTVLMDGRMPFMDGQEAAQRIRAGGTQQYPIKNTTIPIIALTANASKEDQGLYLASGMDGFLSKPIDEKALFEELQKVITSLLSKGVSLPPLTPKEDVEPVTSALPLSGGALDPWPELHSSDFLATTPQQPAFTEALKKLQPASTHSGAKMPLMSRMSSVFIEEAPKRMLSAQAALRAGDAHAVALEMHTLKSSLGYFKLATLQGEFDRLEAMAEAGNLALIESHMDRLNQMLSSCIDTLSNTSDDSDPKRMNTVNLGS